MISIFFYFISVSPNRMIIFWSGFMAAFIVNFAFKVYGRIIWNSFWNIRQHQRNDITEFTGTCYIISGLVLALIGTWFGSYYFFDNYYGFCLFWIYVAIISSNTIRIFAWWKGPNYLNQSKCCFCCVWITILMLNDYCKCVWYQ